MKLLFLFQEGKKINNEHLDLEIPDMHLVTQHILNSPMVTRPSISLLHTPHEIDPCISVEAFPSTESSSEAELVFDSNSGEEDHYIMLDHY